MRMRGLVLCALMCVALAGCGKKTTEYEAAKQNESVVSKGDQQYLDKYWYGAWQKYDSITGEVDEQLHTIDKDLYDGTRPYVIHSMSAEYGIIEYELFDLDTGESEGLWEDSISVDDGTEKIHTVWKDEQFGGQSSYVLARKIKE